jgi:hypothetical protein
MSLYITFLHLFAGGFHSLSLDLLFLVLPAPSSSPHSSQTLKNANSPAFLLPLLPVYLLPFPPTLKNSRELSLIVLSRFLQSSLTGWILGCAHPESPFSAWPIPRSSRDATGVMPRFLQSQRLFLKALSRLRVHLTNFSSLCDN